VYRNGVMLGSADYTASNGTTVVLATGATAGDLITTESFYVSSVLNAIPATAGAVTSAYLLDGSVTAAKMAASGAWAPTGTVIQILNSTYTTQSSVSGTTPVASGLTVTITPKFSTSKIFILVSQNGIYTASNGILAVQSLIRNSTSLFNFDYISGYSVSGGGCGGAASVSYLDSPATTSATTYSTKIACGSSGVINWNNGGCSSSITVMEIAG
jgi:hypothetical protein